MKHAFRPIRIEDFGRYQQYYDRCHQKSADYSFINMWAWNDKYRFKLAYDGELCWICSQNKKHCRLYAPIGDWENSSLSEQIDLLSDCCTKFYRIPEDLAKKLQKDYAGYIVLQEDRGNWEYIYNTKELITLAGQKYRSKRKAANQFKEFYDYEYQALTSKDIPELISFQEKWLDQAENIGDQGLLSEYKAIRRVFENWHIFAHRLLGGILRVNDEIAAYTIAETVKPDELLIHFEKALYSYKGAYAAINQQFLENNPEYKLVNREQDMNDLGLRRVKLNYKPIKFLKKYNIICCNIH